MTKKGKTDKKKFTKAIKQKHGLGTTKSHESIDTITRLQRKFAFLGLSRHRNLYCFLTSIVVLLLVFNLLKTWHDNNQNAGIDFYQFWVIGKVIAGSKASDVYSDNGRYEIGRDFLHNAQIQPQSERYLRAAHVRQRLETYSTPFLYSVFQYFAIANYEFDLTLYTAFLLLCYMLAIIAFCRLLHYSLIRTLIAIIILLGFVPFSSEIRVSNVNSIQLGLLALFAWLQCRCTWKGHYFGAGMVLGFAMMFKPNTVFIIGLLIVSWFINRHYSKLMLEAAGVVTATVGAFFFSIYHFGSTRIWIDWFTQLRNMPDYITPINLGNVGLARFIKEMTGIEVSIYLQIVFVIVSIVCIWYGRFPIVTRANNNGANQERDKKDLLNDMPMIIMGCLIYLISAPLVWLHYLILAIPAVLMIFRPLHNSAYSFTKSNMMILRIIPAIPVVLLNVNILRLLNDTNNYYLFIGAYALPLIFYGITLMEFRHVKSRT